MNAPTPPPGMRILTDDELTKPLPMDAVIWMDDGRGWTPSACRGQMASGMYCYATAEGVTPPTDWRKLCEELMESLSRQLEEVRFALSSDEDSEMSVVHCADESAKALLTRARTLLEETK